MEQCQNFMASWNSLLSTYNIEHNHNDNTKTCVHKIECNYLDYIL